MQTSLKIVVVFFCIFFAASCIKEYSYETGISKSIALGTLQDTLGNCQLITIKGNYNADTTLTDSNYVLVKVNITTAGNYVIATDTVNGFWFRDSGFIVPGLQTIKLKGYGKPILPLNSTFMVTFGNSFCIFEIVFNIPPKVYRDYFPTEIGSNWAYNFLGITDTMHVDATPKDSIIAGNTYRVFISKQNLLPDDTSFYRKNAGNYYSYEAIDDSSNQVELIFLKDNQTVTTQWDSPTANTTLMGAPTEVKIHYTIMAMNTSVNINGNTFDSVIQVKNDLQYKLFGMFSTALSYNTYFAKNIGLINVDAGALFSQSIRRWTIY